MNALPLRLAAALAAGCLLAAPARPDWPQLRGGAAHGGSVYAELKPPFRLLWARHFAGERLGTAMEPVVAGGRLFVATHSGSVYALDARTGAPRWRFRCGGPVLQSPAA